MHFMLGLSTLSLLLTPLMIVFGILIVAGYMSIDKDVNNFILGLSTISAGLWLISSVYQSVKTIKSSKFLKELSLMKKMILTISFPPYFILHTIAGIYAVLDLMRRPFYWSKTEHGLTKSKTTIAKLFNKRS
jgi:hypothetical protein